MIRYLCGKCGAELESPDELIGQDETCGNCGAVGIVPAKRPRRISRRLAWSIGGGFVAVIVTLAIVLPLALTGDKSDPKGKSKSQQRQVPAVGRIDASKPGEFFDCGGNPMVKRRHAEGFPPWADWWRGQDEIKESILWRNELSEAARDELASLCLDLDNRIVQMGDENTVGQLARELGIPAKESPELRERDLTYSRERLLDMAFNLAVKGSLKREASQRYVMLGRTDSTEVVVGIEKGHPAQYYVAPDGRAVMKVAEKQPDKVITRQIDQWKPKVPPDRWEDLIPEAK